MSKRTFIYHILYLRPSSVTTFGCKLPQDCQTGPPKKMFTTFLAYLVWFNQSATCQRLIIRLAQLKCRPIVAKLLQLTTEGVRIVERKREIVQIVNCHWLPFTHYIVYVHKMSSCCCVDFLGHAALAIMMFILHHVSQSCFIWNLSESINQGCCCCLWIYGSTISGE